MINWFSIKALHQSNRAKSFKQKLLEKSDIYIEIKYFNHFPIPYTELKIGYKLNHDTQNHKYLEKWILKILIGTQHRNIQIFRFQISQTVGKIHLLQNKKNKLNFIKIKNVCFLKYTSNNLQLGYKLEEMYITKNMYLEYIERTYTNKSKIINDPIKCGQKLQ